jgi:tetratricopeptide (TPR) repeat protein
MRTLLILTGILAAAVSSSAAPPEEALQRAIREYRSALDCPDRDERLQRFRRAQLLFRQVIEGPHGEDSTGVQNPDLYVNLGNAAMGAERLGDAVLGYRRALALDPDHAGASRNLDQARRSLPKWVPRPEESALLDTFFSWGGRLSRTERQWAAAMLYLVATGLIAASIRWRRRGLRNLAWLPALGWAAVALPLWFESWQPRPADAVVVAPEVVARAADSVHAPARFSQPLPAGTEVEVLERRDGWCRVRLADGREGWLPASSVSGVHMRN